MSAAALSVLKHQQALPTGVSRALRGFASPKYEAMMGNFSKQIASQVLGPSVQIDAVRTALDRNAVAGLGAIAGSPNGDLFARVSKAVAANQLKMSTIAAGEALSPALTPGFRDVVGAAEKANLYGLGELGGIWKQPLIRRIAETARPEAAFTTSQMKIADRLAPELLSPHLAGSRFPSTGAWAASLSRRLVPGLDEVPKLAQLYFASQVKPSPAAFGWNQRLPTHLIGASGLADLPQMNGVAKALNGAFSSLQGPAFSRIAQAAMKTLMPEVLPTGRLAPEAWRTDLAAQFMQTDRALAAWHPSILGATAGMTDGHRMRPQDLLGGIAAQVLGEQSFVSHLPRMWPEDLAMPEAGFVVLEPGFEDALVSEPAAPIGDQVLWRLRGLSGREVLELCSHLCGIGGSGGLVVCEWVDWDVGRATSLLLLFLAACGQYRLFWTGMSA